jgi:hypothetical protein
LPFIALGVLAVPFASAWSSAQATQVSRASSPLSASTLSARSESALPTWKLSGASGSYALLQQATAQPTTQPVAQPTQQASQPAQTPPFAVPPFQRTWERTDKLVASGQVQRSWYWGPVPNTGGILEDYAEGAGGKRLVQYFDKSRMEVNDPTADPNSPFFVTNGLLTVELISGQMQTGNNTFVSRYSADIPLASDPDDTNAPTYLSFRNVANTTLGDHPADSQMGKPATATINRAGQVGDDQTKVTYPKINIAYYDQLTKHNVPQAIWEFLNDQGPVYDSATGKVSNAPLSNPWYYAAGLPISEAYWARVKIAGQMQDVLIQAFQRRVVTYTPNGVPGFKVQMGNIGQHYYDWRYKNAGQSTAVPPTQSTPGTGTTPGATTVPGTPGTGTTPGATVSPTTGAGGINDCNGIPAANGVKVDPPCGPQGTDFDLDAPGFSPLENVNINLVSPDGRSLNDSFRADESGELRDVFVPTDTSLALGIWTVNMTGAGSQHKATGYFKLIPATQESLSCTNFPASKDMVVSPSNCAKRGTTFRFTGTGFDPNEDIGFYLTFPDQAVISDEDLANYLGMDLPLTADGSGKVILPASLPTNLGFPLGVYAMTFEGKSSHHLSIGYFKLIP